MKEKTNWRQIISFLAIVFLLVEVVVLIIQNRELKASLTKLRNQKIPIPLVAGEKVEIAQLERIEGGSIEISYQDSTQNYLLFVFSTTCPFCEKNIENWKRIAAVNKNNRMIILGVSIHNLEDTKKYYAAHKLNFMVALADTGFARKYKVFGVPETVLIKGNGIVKEVFNGVLTDEQIRHIGTFVGI